MKIISTMPRGSATVVTTLLCASLSGCGTNEYVPPPPPEVEVARPVMQTITRSLEFTGTTVPSEKVEIQARVKGYLEEINFDEGSDEVAAGEVLYVIDPKPFEVRKDQADASVKLADAEKLSADAQLLSAEAERDNARQLLQRNRAAGRAITASELEASEAEYEKAEAAVKAAVAAQKSAEAQHLAAQAALDEAKLDLSYTKVQSPISGRVGRTLVDVGNLVGANETTHLTTVISYDPIYAYYTVSELVLLQWIEWQQEGRVSSSPDQTREVFLGLANEQGFPHRGRFDYADLAVDESSGTYLVRAVFDNPEKVIPPGAFVRIQVPLFPEEVLLVDEVAIARDQAGPYVLAVGADQKVERRSIQLGERYEGMRVVESGLSTEDRVVVNGLQFARPGGEVRVTEVPMKNSTDVPDSAPPADAPTTDEPSPTTTG